MLKPNNLTLEQIDLMQDWELLTSMMHFAPTRGDCIELDYRYEYGMNWGEDFSDDEAYKLHTAIWCILKDNSKVSLKGDIDLDEARNLIQDEFSKTIIEDLEGTDGWRYKKKTIISPDLNANSWQDFARHKLKTIIKERMEELNEEDRNE